MYAHVCFNPTYKLTARGRTYFFEWHDFTGPMVVTRKGNLHKRWPFREGHPFWKELERWLAAGKKVDGNGNCLMHDYPVDAK